MKKYRAVFVSDIHLGTRACEAKLLISFLKENTSEQLYLVGDIIDEWKLRKKHYWPQSHSDVIRAVLTAAKNDTEVFYVLGNHDEFLRKWLTWNLQFGRILICNSIDHISATGEKYLVVHGDMFDTMMRKELKWLMHLGSRMYDFTVWLNRYCNFFRKKLGLSYWSLSKYLKTKTKKALQFIDRFEENLALYAEKRGYEGIICGHIHVPKLTKIGDVRYMNDGDFCDNCSAIVETHEGEFILLVLRENKFVALQAFDADGNLLGEKEANNIYSGQRNL